MEIPRTYALIISFSRKKSLYFQFVSGLLLIAGLSLTSTVYASTITYTGTTSDSGPVFNRPIENGLDAPVDLSSDATAVPYDKHVFQVDTSGLYSLLSNTDPVNWDNYLFLYVTSFDPTLPLQNVVIGNDDDPFPGLSGFNATLTTGINYVLVTTGFADFNFGDFSNTIDLLQAQDTGDPSGGVGDPVGSAEAPEPNTFFLFGTGIAIAGFWRRRLFRLS